MNNRCSLLMTQIDQFWESDALNYNPTNRKPQIWVQEQSGTKHKSRDSSRKSIKSRERTLRSSGVPRSSGVVTNESRKTIHTRSRSNTNKTNSTTNLLCCYGWNIKNQQIINRKWVGNLWNGTYR